jgi:RNA polymerase sigma factor (sigma-70 family)
VTGSDQELDRLGSLEGAALSQLEQLYHSHTVWLRTIITRRFRPQPADVDDIVQDTWIRAADRKTGEIQNPKAFLSQTALNLFRDRKRREAVRDNHRRTIAANDAAPAHQAAGLLEQETTLALERLVLSMPEIHRDVFMLSRFRNMTNAQIADHLGISIKTVEWRMGKALELCTIALRS